MRLNAWLVIESLDGNIIETNVFTFDKPGKDEAAMLFRSIVVENEDEQQNDEFLDSLIDDSGWGSYSNGTYRVVLREAGIPV
jgi:hypothetical protein